MRGRLAAAVVVLVVAGCNQSTLTAVSSPRPSASSPAPSPSNAVDFSCRLPVVSSTPGAEAMDYQGGFVQFPEARYTADPAGQMIGREDDVVTTATPVLVGEGVAPFYDRAQSRWVPARAVGALPDGSRYAYVTWDRNTSRHTAFVADVATGSSRAFPLPDINGWIPWVVDFNANGVYLMGLSGLGGPGDRVYLMNPTTGALTEIRQIHQVWTAVDGYAWVARLDPRDKTVWGPSELPWADSLVSINLATGAETIWYYHAGRYPWFAGLDSSGHPLIVFGTDGGNEMRLIDTPGSEGRLIFRNNLSGVAFRQADRDRLWFGSSDGIYVYTPSLGFRKAFAWNGDASNGERIEPAGLCL